MTPQQVLSSADHACYAARESGRNQYVIARAGGKVDRARDLLCIRNVADTLESNAFQFSFQKIVEASRTDGRPRREMPIRMRGAG